MPAIRALAYSRDESSSKPTQPSTASTLPETRNGRVPPNPVPNTIGCVPASPRYARWILIGMILGALGDFFNADLLSALTPQGTLAAIVAFGLGHVCYISAIFGELRLCKHLQVTRIWNCIAVWQFVGLLSWYFIVYHGEKAREILRPALGYTLLLAGTAGIATALAVHRRQTWPLALGAALFLLSDLLLAVGMFRGSYPFRSELVWLTYGPGQMLIVLSAWLINRASESAGSD